jgi:hypothetical protein
MSLQHTANHLAAQGRNGDSVLMHVSPNEVAGLQALAQQHGRSMTTNPDTGMPEAFELKDLLPAAAGFALDYFLPGAGTAVGSMFGLGSAAGTAGIIGGIAGLSSGSLEKGILAGLGAYGGASLAGGLGAAGSNANTLAANNAAQAAGLDDAARVAAIQAAAKPDVRAGLNAAAANPIDFLKNNKFGVAAAALPSLMNMGAQGGTPGAARNPGYIRQYTKNPVTGVLEQASATPVDQFGDQPAVSFGGVGQPVRYAAEGGAIGNHLVYNPTTKKYDTVDASGKPVGPVTFGGVAQSTNMRDPNDTRTDSQKAYDYLMGVPGAKNPMLFYHQQPGETTGALAPADLNTRTGGHYVINAAGTGYDWVPDADSGAGTGIASLVGEGAGGQNVGGGARLDGSYDVTKDVNPNTGSPQAIANSPLGYLAGKIANAISGPQAPAPVVDVAGTPVGSGIDPGTNLQGQGTLGQTGLYGDAAAGLAALAGAADSFGARPTGTIDPGAYEGGFYGLQAFNENARNMGGGPDAPNFDANARAYADAQAAYAAALEAVSAPVGIAPLGGDAPGSDFGGFSGSDFGGADGSGSDKANGGVVGRFAQGGLGSLGGYSDGGRLLRGPGDGVSDSIPATIGRGRQPARLADGEFVVPARIVSELGNGSTAAGARQLYAMMARIQAGRKKSIGKKNVAKNSRAARHLPA